MTLTGENERITSKETEIKRQLLSIAKGELKEGGYEVIEHDFDKTIEEDEEFAYLVNEINNGFEQAKKDLQHGKALPPAEARKIKASVGEAVNVVSEASGADAILLVRYQGFQKSEGQIAKDVGTSVLVGVLTLGAVVPVQPTNGAFAEIALIDGTTGDVLWTDIRGGTLSSQIVDVAMDTMPDDIDAAIVASTPELEKSDATLATTTVAESQMATENQAASESVTTLSNAATAE